MNRARILVGDPHDLIVEGLIRILEAQYEVVAAVSTPGILLGAAFFHRPDLIACDLGMGSLGERNFEVLRQIRLKLPQTKLLGLISGSSAELRGINDLVTGYVAKSSPKLEILTAVAKVLALSDTPIVAAESVLPLPALTSRQQIILRMLAEGKSSKEMAFALNISIKTVEFHRANLRSQLGVRSTAELTKRALQAGL